MAQKELRNLAISEALQDRGALPKEEGDTIRECKAMHEENFLSSWLRDYEEGKRKSKMKVDKKVKAEVGKKEEKGRGEKRELVVPGNARGLVVGLPLPKRPAVTARNALLSPWTGCDRKGEECGERMKGEGMWLASPF